MLVVRADGSRKGWVAVATQDGRFHRAARPLAFSKKTWKGLMERRRLLAGAGLRLPEKLEQGGAAAPDHVLDAAARHGAPVATVEARRAASGGPPQNDRGCRVAIWY